MSTQKIEHFQIDDLLNQELAFHSDSVIHFKLIVDKDDFVVGLYELKPGQEIPKHLDRIDKALYILEGTGEVWIQGKLLPLKEQDTVYVPKNSVTQIRNTSGRDCRIFFFYPKGPHSTLETHFAQDFGNDWGNDFGNDFEGQNVKLTSPHHVPLECWEGIVPVEEARPMAWRTLIDHPSMILGHVKTNPGHDVEAHFHAEAEIIIIIGGEGELRIQGQIYKKLRAVSALYVPSNSIHHIVSTGREPLSKIYFFPQGPFSEVVYNFVDPLTEQSIKKD
jgi:quercetin dioxygenase-like cupin family protein